MEIIDHVCHHSDIPLDSSGILFQSPHPLSLKLHLYVAPIEFLRSELCDGLRVETTQSVLLLKGMHM